MKLFALLVLAAALQGTNAASVTPVEQVLNMLSEMSAKGKKAMATEKQTYLTYKEWVDDEATRLSQEITTGKAQIEELLAYIEKAEADVAMLGNTIEKLDGEIAKAENEKAGATKLREAEHEEYLKVSQDYSESVDALERAIQVLESRNFDVPQAQAFLQQQAAKTPGMRRVLAALLEVQAGSHAQQPGAPEVAAYEFQSQNIIDVLENLLKKFKGELADVEDAESNQAHNYDLVMIHLTDTLEYLNAEREEKAQLKGKRTADSEAAKGQLVDTKAELAEDEKTLRDMKATFASKTATFEANQAVRAEEIEALEKAIEIISDPTVAGSYKEHINLAQTDGHVTSLLQLRSVRSRMTARGRAASFLRKKAASLSSKALAALAAQIQANPFAKVIEMIETLLDKLKEEAAAEADHKAWCDEQLKANKHKRDKKTATVNKLTAEIEELSAEIATMAKQIETLVEDQAALTKAMGEATAQREKEKAENSDTIQDAAAGQEATKRAIVILKEFYASQGASFLQHKQVPEMAEYKGMQSAKKGVVGMLQVIESDFARLLADTKAAEMQAAAEYDEFMTDSKANKLAKHNLEVKTRLEKDQAEFDKEQLSKSRDANQEELDMANKYYDYLKPTCNVVHVSYEERVARRKEEIEALQEAYKILDQKGTA